MWDKKDKHTYPDRTGHQHKLNLVKMIAEKNNNHIHMISWNAAGKVSKENQRHERLYD